MPSASFMSFMFFMSFLFRLLRNPAPKRGPTGVRFIDPPDGHSYILALRTSRSPGTPRRASGRACRGTDRGRRSRETTIGGGAYSGMMTAASQTFERANADPASTATSVSSHVPAAR